ncbi:MAG: hypothetical protein ACXVDA_06080 [Ktedonobacterales bacterium]
MSNENVTPAELHCPLCGGEMTAGTIATYMGIYEVNVPRPGKWFPKQSSVQVRVCLSCGYLMQFATNPERLRP